jgi:hypothetical protein
VILDLGLLLLLSRPGRLFAPQRPRAAVSLSSDRSAYRMSIMHRPAPAQVWLTCVKSYSILVC